MNLLRSLSLPRYWYVILILFISLALRWLLIYRGGQYYFPDEIKYDYSNNIVTSISQKDFSKAFFDLTVTPGQIVFRALGVIPALAENYFHLSALVPALFFSLFSVANLYLIWLIAKRAGLSERGAFIALLLAASSHSLLYYARHLLPYDLALFFGLLALYKGLKPNPGASTFLVTGSLVFLCFASYSGYWPLAGFAAIVPIVTNAQDGVSLLRAALFTFAGLIASFLILMIITSIGANGNILAEYADFAGTITQGNFAEGWSLPFEYLWYSEHLLFIILLILSLYAALNFSRKEQRILAAGLGGNLFIYLCLFVPSTILHKFVVYGRLSRQLMPFLVLAAAYGLVVLMRKGKLGRGIAVAILAVVIAQGMLNYHASAKITFPREFIRLAQVEYPKFKMSEKRTNTGAPFVCQYHDYVAMNVKYIYPAPESLPDIKTNVLLSEPHPINFLPYQYEGYSPAERKLFRKENLRMELIRVESDAQVLDLFGELKSCVANIQ